MVLHEIILSNTYTKTDYLRRLRYLRGYFELKYYTDGEKKGVVAFLKEKDVNEADIKSIKEWGNDFFKSFSKSSFYAQIRDLQNQLKKIKTATVYLSFNPQADFNIRLGEWFRNNVDSSALIELKFDERVIGGCAVVWNSIYLDKSLQSKIENQHYEIMSSILEDGSKESS